VVSIIIRVIKSWKMRWTGNVERKEEMINMYSVLVGQPEGERQLGEHRSGWMILQ
jgi:hypothetical protein